MKKRETLTHNPRIKIYVNNIENRITLKIKAGYYLRLLNFETMKLLGITKNKVTKNENGENIFYFEVTEVALVHCIIVNNDYQHDSRTF